MVEPTTHKLNYNIVWNILSKEKKITAEEFLTSSDFTAAPSINFHDTFALLSQMFVNFSLNVFLFSAKSTFDDTLSSDEDFLVCTSQSINEEKEGCKK